MLGTSQFYCVVTNTVDGQDYSVKSNIVTIYVYKSYIAKLNLYKNENQVLSGQGYWQGKEYNVEVDRVNTRNSTSMLTAPIHTNWRFLPSRRKWSENIP